MAIESTPLPRGFALAKLRAGRQITRQAAPLLFDSKIRSSQLIG